jgi:hypothetical protein
MAVLPPRRSYKVRGVAAAAVVVPAVSVVVCSLPEHAVALAKTVLTATPIHIAWRDISPSELGSSCPDILAPQTQERRSRITPIRRMNADWAKTRIRS